MNNLIIWISCNLNIEWLSLTAKCRNSCCSVTFFESKCLLLHSLTLPYIKLNLISLMQLKDDGEFCQTFSLIFTRSRGKCINMILEFSLCISTKLLCNNASLLCHTSNAKLWLANDIKHFIPVQDGLQVQDDLSLMVFATGLPLLFLHCHELPWRHIDLSSRHRPSPKSCTQTGPSTHVNILITHMHAVMLFNA